MYEQEFQGDVLYMMLYAVVAVLNLVASCYLLFRRGNAIAPDITSPIRLRRWTGVFFTAMTLSHLWYMPSIYLTSSEDKMLCYDIGGMLLQRKIWAATSLIMKLRNLRLFLTLQMRRQI